MKLLISQIGLLALLVGGVAQSREKLPRPLSPSDEVESISCAVGKAVGVAKALGEIGDVFAVALEMGPDGRTIVVELGAIEERGGGVIVEVDLEKCEVMEVFHSQ